MNQQKVIDVSAAMAKLFKKSQKPKRNRPVKKALKQSKSKKNKANKNVTPPKSKTRAKSIAQIKRNLKLLTK